MPNLENGKWCQFISFNYNRGVLSRLFILLLYIAPFNKNNNELSRALALFLVNLISLLTIYLKDHHSNSLKGDVYLILLDFQIDLWVIMKKNKLIERKTKIRTC